MEKKCYQLGTYTAEDWHYIHEVLMRDGTLEDNIPPRSVECTDDKLHSETRGTYLLSEDEVDELINHPKIKFINLDPSVYPEVLPPPQPGSSRYSSAVKNYRNPVGVCPNTNPTSAELNRTGYQLLRLTQKNDPWNGNSSTVISSNITYTYDGRHVDLVVGDNGVWIGHPEFINTGNGPTKFIGGNVLSRRNGETALCGVLDLIFDLDNLCNQFRGEKTMQQIKETLLDDYETKGMIKRNPNRIAGDSSTVDFLKYEFILWNSLGLLVSTNGQPEKSFNWKKITEISSLPDL
jgi:hypothetical protein